MDEKTEIAQSFNRFKFLAVSFNELIGSDNIVELTKEKYEDLTSRYDERWKRNLDNILETEIVDKKKLQNFISYSLFQLAIKFAQFAEDKNNQTLFVFEDFAEAWIATAEADDKGYSKSLWEQLVGGAREIISKFSPQNEEEKRYVKIIKKIIKTKVL